MLSGVFCFSALVSMLPQDEMPVHGLGPPVNLRCEYRVNPLGIDETSPRLSWEVNDTRRGTRQTAYQLVAGTDRSALEEVGGARIRAGNLVWSTGKVKTDACNQIVYAGQPLKSRMRVFWRVRTWDADDKPSPWSEIAHWSMGLLDPAEWEAKWIGDPAEPPRYVPPHNGYQSQLAKAADTLKWVTVDLGQTQTVDGIVLHPANPFNWKRREPGFLFPLRFQAAISDEPDFKNPRTLIDQTAADVPAATDQPLRVSATPATGRYVRLTVTRLRPREENEYGFALAEMQVLSGGQVVSEKKNVVAGTHRTDGGENVPDSIEQSAWGARRLVDGDLSSHPASGIDPLPATMLRKEVTAAGGESGGGSIRRATVYVTALGLYELYINGRRVGDSLFDPNWTDYHARVLYQTYDATDLVKSGPNTIAVILGDGWYAGRIGLSNIVPDGPPRGLYGRKTKLLLRLEIEREDGTVQSIVTDETWRCTTDGSIRSSDILDGETCDGRKTTLLAHGDEGKHGQVPWNRPGFDDSSWKPVRTYDPTRLHEQVPGRAAVAPPHPPKLIAQPNEPIRVVKELRPISLTKPKPGVYVFDMGQNMVGWCRLTMEGPAGETIVLRHAEVLKPDGTIFTDNLRSAAATDRYTFSGGRPALGADPAGGSARGAEVFEPRFTYHGFRYVELTAADTGPDRQLPKVLERLSTDNGPDGSPVLVGVAVNSACREVGRFECSEPMLNKLWENVLWTQRGNMPSIPTDCPQRDERCGWMGDILAFCQAACFNMDMAAFLTKWLQDVRDAQADDGRLPDFAPHPYGRNERFTGVPAWGDAGVFVPWRMYINYGDKRVLERSYESAKRWVDWIQSKNPDDLWKNARHNDYGDWLTADTFKIEGFPKKGADTPHDVFATLFFAESAELVSKMAEALGRKDDGEKYRVLAQKIEAAFAKAYVKPDGTMEGNTQGGYALALRFGLMPHDRKESAVQHMVDGFKPYKGHLSTGFHSTGPLMHELVRNGHREEAYRLALNRTMPSWGYLIDHGATTIWERWDGYVEGKGFQDSGMNSFSHFAFGAVAEWMYRVIGGINPDDGVFHASNEPMRPGYKHIRIRPQPGGGLTWARTEHHSIHGRIATSWKLEGGTYSLDVTIPANTTATIYVRASDPKKVTEGGQPAETAEGVKYIGQDAVATVRDGKSHLDAGSYAAVYSVGAGTYRFAAPAE